VEARSPRRRAGRDPREGQILDAAVAVFGEHGFHATSMDAVAERVGLAVPVLATHFASTDALFRACVNRAKTELLEVTSAAAGLAETPEGMLRLSMTAYFDHIERNAATWRLLGSDAAAALGALEAVRAQQTDFIASLLAERAPQVDPYRLAGWTQVIVGAGERLAAWRAEVRTVTARQATDCLMDVVWTGLAALGVDRAQPAQHNGRR
jgi:AcrR family transcriptional regulator